MTQTKFLRWVPTLLLLAAIALVLAFMVNGRPAVDAAEEQHGQPHIASIEHLTLNEMTDRAATIFRGEVVAMVPGTVSAGGGELPVVTYRFRVDHALKGDFASKDGVAYAEVTMLGSVKEKAAQGDMQHLASLPTPPALTIGSDYLLLMTSQSDAGLSSPVGLGQGSFEIFELNKQEMAQNSFANATIASGPVPYDDLAAQIERLVGE